MPGDRHSDQPTGPGQRAAADSREQRLASWRARRSTDRPRERGQTTIDFAIGISVFLVVLVFVFLFVPNLLEPFNTGTQEETVAVNRLADELSGRMLGNVSDPYIVSSACTTRFFDGRSPGPCDFRDGSIEDQLRLEGRQNVNVTITRLEAIDITNETDVQCWDRTNRSTVNASASGCDVRLQRGESVPRGSGSSVSARRVINIEGEAVSIKVVMW